MVRNMSFVKILDINASFLKTAANKHFMDELSCPKTDLS